MSLFQMFGDISFQLDVLHCAALIASLRQQQVAGQQCNFAINVRSKTKELKTFNVHKCILAAISNEIANTDTYVAGMELQSNEVAVQRLIDFAYTGKISDLQELSVESVVEIWELAVTLKAAYFRSYLLKARPDVRSRIVHDRGGVDSPSVVPITLNSSLSPVYISGSITTVPDKSTNEFIGLNNENTSRSHCIPEVCDMSVKMEHNADEMNSTFPSDYSNSESPSPVGFPITLETKNARFSFPAISKPRAAHSEKSKNKSHRVKKSVKTVRKKVINPINNTSKSSSLVDPNKKEKVITKTNVKNKQASASARSKRPKVDETAAKEPEAKSAKTKLLENYEQTDIDLLKELKELAPNASLWSVIPDLH